MDERGGGGMGYGWEGEEGVINMCGGRIGVVVCLVRSVVVWLLLSLVVVFFCF